MKLMLIFLFLLSFKLSALESVIVKNEVTTKALTVCEIKHNKTYIEILNLRDSDHKCLQRAQRNFYRKKLFGAELEKNKPLIFIDSEIGINKDEQIKIGEEDGKLFALAKKEFGLPQFLKKYPHYDGRGVIAGVIDDGVSPHHSGFKNTTTGQRKYIGRFSNSTAYTFALEKNIDQTINFDNTATKPSHIIKFDESKYKHDFNNDGKETKLTFAIIEIGQNTYLCLDQDLDEQYKKSDCQRSFKEFGDFGYWDIKKTVPIIAEIDLSNKILQISEGEWRRDAHGEGVASVFVGHQLFGKYNGVAPGAQLLDYDLSEYAFSSDEKAYTIGKFLKAIAKLAENGAEVINISYSFYFYSTSSQNLMSDALNSLIEDFNIILVFSAGNNGPGLGSMNRSLIYPKKSLVAGAFISKEMDSLVHGATGIDDQGQIIYYSSLGPGADYGMGPTLISPLASITHADARGSARSFSGTSSAAPALAGFAAVLLSAAKQEGLPIKVDAIISAIKLSGDQLENTPYVFQGFGLPKIEQALKNYKSILSGRLPSMALIGSSWLPRRDGVYSRGVVRNLSEVTEREEFRLVLNSQFYLNELNLEDAQNLMMVELEYSHDWITGPGVSWISNGGGAAFSVTADYSMISSNSEELFGEVRVRDMNSKTLLAVFPVTILNKKLFDRALKYQVTLGPEKASRIHFITGANTNGLELNIDLTPYRGERVTYRLYDKFGVRVKSGSLFGGDDLNIDHELSSNSSYQLAFSRYRGNKEISFDVKLKPIKIDLLTTIATLTDNIELKNHSHLSVKGHLGFRSKAEPIATGLVKSTDGIKLSFYYEVSKKGHYSVKLSSPKVIDLSYLSWRCFQKREGSSSEFSNGLFELKEDQEQNITINVDCYIFDLAQGVNFTDSFEYRVTNESTISETWTKIMKIDPLSRAKFTQPAMSISPGEYEAFFESSQGARIPLGDIIFYP